VKLAEAAEPFRSLINPNDPRFVSPEGMSVRIAEFCKETGQAVPETPGQFVRCALESLALLYRVTLKQLEKLTEQPIERLHIFGGGCQNRALNQWTANATGIPVYAGPVEATALGNMMIQAIALGDIESWEAGRASIGRSFPVEIYQPADADQWALQSELFARLLER
jgi:rhamnulokinase